MAKLPEEGYVVSIGTEGYWVSDGFAELLIQLLQYGDTSNVILTTKTAIQDEKLKLLSDIHSLSIEKEKLKEELEFVRGDNTKFEEDVKQLKNDLEESQRNNMELAADVKALEIGFDIKGTSSVEFRKNIQKLQEENIKLMNVCNYLQHRNEGLSGSVEMLKKENKELKEQFTMDDNTKFEDDVKQLNSEKRRLEVELEKSQHNNMELVAENQGLIQKNFELDSQVNTLKKSRDGYRDCLQQKLQEENDKLRQDNDKLRQDNKEISDNIKKLRTQCSTLVGQRNKYYELYKLLTVENRRLHRGFAVLDLDNFIKEGVRERCFKLQAENEELKTQSSSLQKENVRLVEEREDLQKQNEYLSGSIEKICNIHAKEKAELKEQLETSSDLTMTNELANIFDEYAGAEQKNHNILVDKLAKFQDKHKLTRADGELKRG